jgi:hypothetical protein
MKYKFPTKAELSAWIAARNPEEIFNCQNPFDCLFSRYFKSLGAKDVSNWYGETSVDDKMIVSPNWADAFLNIMTINGSRLTMSRALSILAEIKEN